MDPKTMKRRHDEGQRELAAERERTRYLETQCETLAREVLPVRAYKSAKAAAVSLAAPQFEDAVNAAAMTVQSVADEFARIASALDSRHRAAHDRLRAARVEIEQAAAKLRPEPPAHADLVETLESANTKILEQGQMIEVRAARIAFLEGEIVGLRRDSIAANAEADRAAARASAAENRVRDVFYRLTRDLAPGWQGKSLRDLMGDPTHARRMHVLLQRVIDWLNEEAQRPEPRPVDLPPVGPMEIAAVAHEKGVRADLPAIDGDADCCGEPSTLAVTEILDEVAL